MDDWIIFTLLGASFLTISNIINKSISSKLNEYSLGWARNLFSLPVFWIMLYFSGIPLVNPKFWQTIIFILPVEIILAILYFRALKVSPLSLTIPITSFFTLFIAVGAFVILGERLDLVHILYLILIVLGAYILNLSSIKKDDLFKPVLSLFREKGVLYMILAGVLFGITIPFGKILTQYSSPQFFTTIYYSLFVILFTPIFFLKGTQGLKGVKDNFLSVFCMGITNGIFLFFAWKATSIGSAALVNALQNINILMTVVAAGIFLKEEGLLQRITASIFMMIGASLIALYA